ncbi:MAG: Holliday junction branch migration protein RuvA [Coriobacteriia bacterium]
MIAFLTGRVAHKTASWCIVEVGGVGFKLAMSTSSLAALPAEGDEVTLHTYLHVREDELSLFGFESVMERELFELLISVSGVGPKVALAVLSSLDPEALTGAIAGEDVALLSSVPGIGKKTAQRLIIELKDRFDAGVGPSAVRGSASDALSGARDALLGMGFSAAEAAAALREAPAGAGDAELLRHALKRLGSGR